MSELKTLYNIIPVEDRCSFLCEDFNGTHLTISKGKMTAPIRGWKLIFKSADMAQKYINSCLDPTQYFVEEFSGNDEIYKLAEICEAII